MTVAIKNAVKSPISGGGISWMMSGRGPKPMLTPEDGTGNGDAGVAEAARLAAEKAAADKAAADKAAADKAEADRLAQEEAEKNMSEADKEKQKLLHEVMEKKGKLKETEDALAAARADADRFKGIDLEKVKALLDAEKQREEKDLEAKGEFDRLKQRIADERELERKAWNDEKVALENRVKKLSGDVDDLTVGQNFSSSTFIKEDLILTPTKARILYGTHFEMQDGKTVAYDKPAGSANRTLMVDAGGNPLEFDIAMRKIIEADPEKDMMLKSKITPGAGSKNHAGSKSQQETVNKKGDLFGASRILAGLNATGK